MGHSGGQPPRGCVQGQLAGGGAAAPDGVLPGLDHSQAPQQSLGTAGFRVLPPPPTATTLLPAWPCASDGIVDVLFARSCFRYDA